MHRAVVIYSGGMDSYTMLNMLLTPKWQQTYCGEEDGLELLPLSFDYGQRHRIELEYAKLVCENIGLRHEVAQVESVIDLMRGSALTSPDVEVPYGHYAEETMKATVVPNRNMVLLSMAIAYAISTESNMVFYGAHSGDHAIYPDCRPEFVGAMNAVASLCHYTPVQIHAPYLHHNKISILRDGLALGLDYGYAWTCYEGGTRPCGECGACQERAEAFAENGVDDPGMDNPAHYRELVETIEEG